LSLWPGERFLPQRGGSLQAIKAHREAQVKIGLQVCSPSNAPKGWGDG
jgi:hypothetical protein